MREAHAEHERDFASSRDLLRRDESSPERGYSRPSYGRGTSRYNRSLREENDNRRYGRDDERLSRDRYERRRSDGDHNSSYRRQAPGGGDDYQSRDDEDRHIVETGSDIMRSRRRRNGYNDTRDAEHYRPSQKRERSDDEGSEPAKRRRHSDGALQGRSRRDSRDSDMDQDSPPRDYRKRDGEYSTRKNGGSDGHSRHELRNERYDRGSNGTRYGYERRGGEGYCDRREERYRHTTRRSTEYSPPNDRFRGRVESPRQKRYQSGSGNYNTSDRPPHYSNRFESDDCRMDYRSRQVRKEHESTTPQQGRQAQPAWAGRGGTGQYGSSRSFDYNRLGGVRDIGGNRSVGSGRDKSDGSHYKRDNFGRNEGFHSNSGGRFNKDRSAVGNTGGGTCSRWEWNESETKYTKCDPDAYHDDTVYLFGSVRFKDERWADVSAISDVPEIYKTVESTMRAEREKRNEAGNKEDGFDPPSGDFAPLCDEKTIENDAKTGDHMDVGDKTHVKNEPVPTVPDSTGQQSEKPTVHTMDGIESQSDTCTATKQTDASKEDRQSTVSEITTPNAEGKSLDDEQSEE
ncbi:hypothetical protein BWQ96_01299 [Gracilariopsis chorda]|uniref:Uncharacterized protein n=1 Tax=Gracilariopsis chorda TaxID=448386 RepID=A0A2V3J4N6_9FLOR|nr:hypothetical protein BWQ96_01299 [Gracilariopsis chorda]|eukprot:PXF48957.1 hypothetical protein BWQ96_01299 [Gracilariopsis chorda]